MTARAGRVPKIGVFAHMFHVSMFEEMRRYLLNIPWPSDLHLSTCDEAKAYALKVVFAAWSGDVTVRVVENRGRDIAPKLITFAADHQRYDYVLHVHTKSQEDWRRFLLDRLLWSKDWIAGRILRALDDDPAMGMIAPEYWPAIEPWAAWGPNRAICERLLSRMGVRPFDIWGLTFPAGSMFWARPSALRPLFDLGLSFKDFPPEPIGFDGTLAHAVERLLFISCEVAGYRWKMVTHPLGFLTHLSMYHPWPDHRRTA